MILPIQDTQTEAEKELQKTQQELSNYRFALDASCIVSITDQDGIIQQVNDNFCKISKYHKSDLIGQDHRIISSGYHTKGFVAHLWNTIKEGNIWRGEMKNKNKDGTMYWVDTSIVPFFNSDGKPYEYIAIHTNITEQKKTEHKIKRINDELEEKINRRTEELRKKNEEMEAFSYSVSHDLRAPLRGIMGFTNILEEEYSSKLDDEARRITGVIKRNTQKMTKLIDGLLTFSRVGSGEINKSVIDTNKMVEQVILELEHLNRQSQFSWVIQPLPSMYGDVNTLHQVWVNLLSNAMKYSAIGPNPKIEISSFQKDDQLVFAVRDNGVGFNEAYGNKLFKVFQRLHGMNEFEGTGVGLAIVERIISRHGGRVWAEGKVNKGASFYFSLPENKN